jgi:hypothetical protein
VEQKVLLQMDDRPAHPAVEATVEVRLLEIQGWVHTNHTFELRLHQP